MKHFQDKLLFVFIVLAVSLRLLPIWGNNFTFMYDHAKDSLVIMDMVVNLKPALYGAVTSIPGVFNGPAYYYLALPVNILFGFHPVSGVMLILALVVLNVVLIYKYLGRLEALLYVASSGLIGTQQSAWSPYMTVFLTVPILILMLKFFKPRQNVETWQVVALFGCISLLFHPQTAFGVVMLLIVMGILFWQKIQLTGKQAVAALAAFAIPFAPFAVFELRHSFHQTKQVINFIQNYSSQTEQIQSTTTGFAKVVELTGNWLDYAGRTMSPLDLPVATTTLIGFVAASYGGYYLWHKLETAKSKSKKLAAQNEMVIFGGLLVGTLVAYFVLPAKAYYFVGLMPVWIVLVSRALKVFVSPKNIRRIALIIFALSSVNLYQSSLNYRVHAQQSSILLAPKIEAVDLVYELSNGQPFASYHYVPEIYDYTYQFLFLRAIEQGKPQPVEFSYKPGEVSYIPQKHLESPIREDLPSQIFLIVEEPELLPNAYFDQWWGEMEELVEVEKQHRINERISVYEAKLKY